MEGSNYYYSKVKWIEGLYRFWDGVRAAKPGAVVEVEVDEITKASE